MSIVPYKYSDDSSMSEYETEVSESTDSDQTTTSKDYSDQDSHESSESASFSFQSDQSVSQEAAGTAAVPDSNSKATSKLGRSTHSLEPQNTSPEIHQFFKDLKSFWTRNHNLQRGTAAITVTTFNKAKERMSCEYRHV